MLPDGMTLRAETDNFITVRLDRIEDMTMSESRRLLSELERLLAAGYVPLGVCAWAPLAYCRKPTP